ncbi:MAG: hypothetical protein HQ592_03920 [Planctomycetes bacterium]|nr:hypothetical protein [Planctomycetota bacterium]
MGPGAGPATVRLVLLVQCVLLGCVVPFFCSADAAARPITNAAGAFIRACGIIAASCVIALVLALIAGRPLPPAWAVRSAGILVGFALVLIGICSIAGRLGAAAPVRQMAAYAVAALMLGTVFYANPAVAATRGKAKLAAVQTAVAANPLVCVAGAALDYDIMLSRRAEPSLYTQSLIGPDHLYRYPRWWAAGAAYSAVGLVMLFISFIGSKESLKATGE